MEDNKTKEDKLVLKLLTRTSSWSLQNNTATGTTLTFTNDRLDIKYLGLFTFSFLKEDIISIEPYEVNSLISSLSINWIKINHKVSKYFSFLVFGSMSKSSEEIIKEIESTGFLDKSSLTTNQDIIDDVRKVQKKEIIPDYLWILIAICILVISIVMITSLI